GIAAALDDFDQNPEVGVVLLSGEGGDFCSGMDLSANFDEGSAPYERSAEAVSNFGKPIVAAVDGIAIGGGATIPFHCDLVYVGESLRMRLPFVSLGLVPEYCSSYMLQANIGYRRAAELMFTAEWIDAAKALEVGIATAVYPDSELHAKALEKAREIAQWPVSSLKATKQCMKASHAVALKAALEIESEKMAQQIGSPENVEAITAFLQKRKPDFKGL
ncbi:MAG: enoyl-CoA hydratase/isomerase family protein, partial [Deltaproteobacteria bacterium]|nr:enoyl-CoA hydratase/isomerase family protein [Deltaproteobacteria bacterium]